MCPWARIPITRPSPRHPSSTPPRYRPPLKSARRRSQRSTCDGWPFDAADGSREAEGRRARRKRHPHARSRRRRDARTGAHSGRAVRDGFSRRPLRTKRRARWSRSSRSGWPGSRPPTAQFSQFRPEHESRTEDRHGYQFGAARLRPGPAGPTGRARFLGRGDGLLPLALAEDRPATSPCPPRPNGNGPAAPAPPRRSGSADSTPITRRSPTWATERWRSSPPTPPSTTTPPPARW